MSATKPTTPPDNTLQNFSRQSPCVYYLSNSEPTKTEPSAESVSNNADIDNVNASSNHSDSRPPDLIILCTWVNAAPRHIAKYTAAYSSLYPSAAQLLITTSLADMSYRRNPAQRSRLAPAVRIIIAATSPSTPSPSPGPPNPKPRILLHIFSHGGAHTVCQLATAFRAQTSRPLPIGVMILDSTPGHGTYKRSLDAIVLSMPKSALIRVLGTPLAHAYLSTVWLMDRLLGVENVVQRLRLGLSDKRLFAEEAPRLYAYSKADRMVWWEDVEEHAKAAEDAGWEVERVRFEESPHAGHILEDGERYWGAVRRTWEKGKG